MRNRVAGSAGRADASNGTERVVPRGVAKAIRFMQDNLAVDLAVSAIATAADTSERTLRRQFQRFTGQSPVAFHRNLRLEAANRDLHDDHTETDVTAAAGAYGFSHFGHFTAQYRRRFGELPSETLRARCETVVRLPKPAVYNSVTLVVLPFSCADGGSAETALADATTDRVISALGRTRWLNVLGPQQDPWATVDTGIAAPPRARYAVVGRVQSFGGRVQVVMRLFEAATGRHIWGNAFDDTPEHALDLQDRVVEGVAGTLLTHVHNAETARGKRKPVRDPIAVNLAMRAFRAASEITQSANARALEDLDRALSIDPEFPFAMALTAWCNAQRVVCCFGGALDVERNKARVLTGLTLSMDNEDPRVLAVLGNACTIFGDLDLGHSLIEKCLAIDPHCLMAWQRRGWIAIYRGGNTALADFSRCVTLGPRGPEEFNTMLGISQAHFLAGNYDQAADWAVRGIQERASETWACRIAAVAQVRCGRTADARHNVALLRRQYPDLTVGSIVNALPMQAELLARNAEGLESAGLPA